MEPVTSESIPELTPEPLAEPQRSLDLRGIPCPLNFIRTRLALETLLPGAWLQVDLDAGEPERMVVEGLRGEGHRVDRHRAEAEATGVRLLIRRHGG